MHLHIWDVLITFRKTSIPFLAWAPFFIAAFNSLFNTEIKAQQLRQMRFQQLLPDDGLSQNQVQAIIQDANGFMWFATVNGLNHFDGQTIKVYKPDRNNPNSLSHGDVNEVYQTKNKEIWLGSHGGGLCLFNGIEESFECWPLPEENGARKDGVVRTIVEDHQGRLWVGTRLMGVTLFDRENKQFSKGVPILNHKADGDDFQIRSLLVDRKGDLWAGTLSGLLLRLNEEKGGFEIYPGPPERPEIKAIHSLIEDRDGNIWVGSTAGLAKIKNGDPNTIKTILLNPQGQEPKLRALLEDRRGNLWCGGTNRGLIKYDMTDGSTEFFPVNHAYASSLTDNQVMAIVQGKDDVIWIATMRGVSFFNHYNHYFTLYRSDVNNPDSISDDRVKAIHADDQEIWVGLGRDSGLVNLNRKTGMATTHKQDSSNPDAISSNYIHAICKDREGRLWLGSEGGVDLMNPDRKSFLNFSGQQNGLAHDAVFALMEDRQRRFWVGSYKGVHTLNRETGQFTRIKQSGPGGPEWNSDFINNFYQDDNDTIWVGLFSQGMKMYDQNTGTFKKFVHDPDDPNSLPGDQVNGFREINGRFWVATSGGLALMDRDTGRFTTLTESDGLPDNMIYAVVPDESGRLWLSTNYGLATYDPDSKVIRSFYVNDGLQDWEFNSRAFFRTASGEIFFGGMRGMNSFIPEKLPKDKPPPPVKITEFKINNKHVAGHDKLNQLDRVVLETGDQVLSFDFAALDYSSMGHHRYMCKLDGFNEEWVTLGKKSDQTYTNLDPGTYTFSVKAMGRDGLFGEPDSVVLEVKPAFWQTLAFRIAVAITLLIMPWLIYSIRIRNARARNKLLQDEVTRRKKAEKRVLDLNVDLETRVQERTAELEQAQKRLIDSAHQAGMAEIATSVLHNIGNTLNSITVSNQMNLQALDSSPLPNFQKANDLLREALESKTPDPDKLAKISLYFQGISDRLTNDNTNLAKNTRRITELVSKVREEIRFQEQYAQSEHHTTSICLQEVVNDAIKIIMDNLEEAKVTVTRSFESTSSVAAYKNKLVQMIVQVINNGVEAMAETPISQKRLDLSIKQQAGLVVLTIRDFGHGIDPQNLESIFRQGFTTRRDRYGLGLHSCANAIREIGGDIQAESQGLGTGAAIIMRFPATPNLS